MAGAQVHGHGIDSHVAARWCRCHRYAAAVTSNTAHRATARRDRQRPVVDRTRTASGCAVSRAWWRQG